MDRSLPGRSVIHDLFLLENVAQVRRVSSVGVAGIDAIYIKEHYFSCCDHLQFQQSFQIQVAC